jgi:hypothetical protein
VRDLALRAAVLAGAAAVLLIEALSACGWIRRGPVAVAWIVLLAGAAVWVWRHPPELPRLQWRPFETAIVAAIGITVGIVAVTAWWSPPNSADAMAYHLPRVVYWAQAGSVRFFPTPYFNQISLQPVDEYLMLHTYVLSGGDRWINLLTVGAYLLAIVAVSAAAREMGLGTRGQAIAALFCATLPNGILQASGAKNEWLLVLWMVAAVYFARRGEAVWLALAVGLALGTKATAYLFLPPVLLACRLRWRKLAWIAAAVLVLDGPQFARNVQLSGGPLGYDSAQGNGVYRWRNESPGWRSTVSNALRHTSEQLGGRSSRWNARVYDAVLRAHRALGLDPQDPSTTWPGTVYGAPRNANHEADANNRWHLLLGVAGALFAIATRRRNVAWLCAGLAAGFLLFCFYLKWQPFMARLELPLFVLAAIPAAVLLDRLRPAIVPAAICLFLAMNARLPLLENWTRPLKGPSSVFRTDRDTRYFADMWQWNNRESYVEAVGRTARSRCLRVGIDINENQLEYPFQALLRERAAGVLFEHTGVENASARYFREAPRPCAVICLDCAGNAKRVAMYEGVGRPETMGRFLLFVGTKKEAAR